LTIAHIRDINDFDEDEDGQIVDYSGDSDDGNKSEEDLPEEILLILRWLRECNGMLGKVVSGTYWISWPASV
jgi:hypothetical protein